MWSIWNIPLVHWKYITQWYTGMIYIYIPWGLFLGPLVAEFLEAKDSAGRFRRSDPCSLA